MNPDVNVVCDFLILRCHATGVSLNLLKLQKLLYYCQAWSLALGRGRLFEGRFQAWVHGPVNREIYRRFVSEPSASLYRVVEVSEVFSYTPDIDDTQQLTVQQVLDVYAQFSGTQLEMMTHNEAPWLKARAGIGPFARCETEISETDMAEYYGARLIK